MIDDGLGFSLVPWQPVLEQRLGRQVTGADAETSARLRRSLRAYCHRDTWAMVRLHQALNVLAARSK